MKDLCNREIKEGDFVEIIGLIGIFKIVKFLESPDSVFKKGRLKDEHVIQCNFITFPKNIKNRKNISTGYGLKLKVVITTNYWVIKKKKKSYKTTVFSGGLIEWPFGSNKKWKSFQERRIQLTKIPEVKDQAERELAREKD